MTKKEIKEIQQRGNQREAIEKQIAAVQDKIEVDRRNFKAYVCRLKDKPKQFCYSLNSGLPSQT